MCDIVCQRIKAFLDFAFPDDNDMPAGLLQRGLLLFVAGDIACELLGPEFHVGFWHCGDFAAYVPIAIQKNNNTNLSDKIPHCSVKLPCSATAQLRSFSLHCEIFSRNLYAAIFLDCYSCADDQHKLAASQFARKPNCCSVWNQCSPPCITVRPAPVRSAKPVIVSRLVRLSFSP